MDSKMDSDVDDRRFIFPFNESLKEVKVSEKEPFLDALTEFVNQVIFDIILGASISMFGIVANIINIVVFIRQGIFSDGSNLNLFCLALGDLGGVVTSLLHSVGISVLLADLPDLAWDNFSVAYLAITWPNAMFVVSTRLLTAYIAFERCLCVMLPFRVKTLFAPRRSLVYILIMFAYSFLSHIPIYLTHSLEYEIQKDTNISKLFLVFGPGNERVSDIIDYLNFFVLTFATVIIVFICTVITSSHINTSKEWRQSVTNTDGVKSSTNRTNTTTSFNIKETTDGNDESCNNKKVIKPATDKETRLVKTITLVSIICLICSVPEVVFGVARTVDKRISGAGQYSGLSHLIYSIIFVATVINSSVNIFVYYTMSSRYRKEFRKLCGMSDVNGN